MVSRARTSLRARKLRTLNEPRRVAVTCNAGGNPAEVQLQRRYRVRAIHDRWRLDDDWWRKPIRRLYYLVELEGGALYTLYHDLETGVWYRQPERPGVR